MASSTDKVSDFARVGRVTVGGRGVDRVLRGGRIAEVDEPVDIVVNGGGKPRTVLDRFVEHVTVLGRARSASV